MAPEPAQRPQDAPARRRWLPVLRRLCRSLLRHHTARALRSTAAHLCRAADRLDRPTARNRAVGRGRLSPAVRTYLDGLAAEQRAASRARHPSTTGRRPSPHLRPVIDRKAEAEEFWRRVDAGQIPKRGDRP